MKTSNFLNLFLFKNNFICNILFLKNNKTTKTHYLKTTFFLFFKMKNNFLLSNMFYTFFIWKNSFQ